MTAGWYPDPSGRFEQRYHDGTQWTTHVSRAGLTFVDPTPVPPIPAPPSSAPASGKPTSRKRSHAMVALTGSALVVIAIALSIAVNRDDTPSATGANDHAEPTTPPSWEVQCPGASSVLVEYRVLGTTTVASITYSTPNGGTAQHSDIAVPLKNLKGGDAISECYKSRDELYISAQNSKSSGTVICTITRDGIEIARVQASGAYAIATCGR